MGKRHHNTHIVTSCTGRSGTPVQVKQLNQTCKECCSVLFVKYLMDWLIDDEVQRTLLRSVCDGIVFNYNTCPSI